MEHIAPSVSIIIPVYNIATYLHECLNSILGQTFKDWEAICVDDGSSDGSGEILEEYASRDFRFRVVHQSNAGVSAARNKALDIAKGEWVWFVDGDDAIHPEALGWVKRAIDANPGIESVGMLHGNLEGRRIPNTWPPLPTIDFVEHLTSRCSKAIAMHRRAAWGTIVRRDKTRDLRFRAYKIGEDAVFQMEYFWRTKSWLLAEVPLYFYRTRRDSAMTGRMSADKLLDSIAAERDMLLMMEKHRHEINIVHCKDYLEWNGRHVYQTLSRQLSLLPTNDRVKLIYRWVGLQKLQYEIFPHIGVLRRFVVWAVDKSRSPFLFNALILRIPIFAARVVSVLG